MGRKILPFFLPMYGCPHHCIFCDQKTISGEEKAPSDREILEAIDVFPEQTQGELAYYGGSFTCLPQSVQQHYLELGQEGILQGKFAGIRISTRPDAVSRKQCEFLKTQGVITVELGIQSFDDEVLAASGRGYTGAMAEEGCRNVRESGLTLGLQLMTGLPRDTPEKDIRSMEKALTPGAALLRIYPTLVLEGTALAELWRKGEYRPQTIEEAVAVCRDMLIMAEQGGLKVQRMGINPSADVEAALLDGPYHPAFGGLVREAVKKQQILALLADFPAEASGILRFPRNELPLVFGQKRSFMLELGRRWPGLALMPIDGMEPGTVELVQTGKREK